MIAKKIKELAKESLGAELNDNDSLKECGVDSLSLVVLIAEIESNYGFEFDESDLQPDKLNTLADLTEITEKYV